MFESNLSLQHSVLSNLDTLLNTRCGSLLHMPDYGLPECQQAQFITAIRKLISQYEPRITELVVTKTETTPVGSMMQIQIAATVAAFEELEQLCMDATILSSGQVVIGMSG